MLLMIEKPRPTAAERGLAALSRAAHAVPAVLDGLVMGPFRAMERRRVIATLAAMSEHDLRDIGLSRGDIRDAMAMPVGSDGSVFLARRREARRVGG